MFVVVAGAGTVGRKITAQLMGNNHDVVVIDTDHDVCSSLYSETGVETVEGNATRLSVLMASHLKKADVLVCLMRSDADNIATAILARSLGVERILARMRDPGYADAYKLSGVSTVLRVADLLINQVMTEIEQPKVKRIIPLAGGAAEMYAVVIDKKSWAVGKTVTKLAKHKHFPREAILAGIYRVATEAFVVPRGDSELEEGDTVYVVTPSRHIKAIADILTS
ncbi:MAG: NAD-binding protein [Candidatus Neomarinimicrobiota bacterium]